MLYNCCITYILERVWCVSYRCPVLCIVSSFMQNVDIYNFLCSHLYMYVEYVRVEALVVRMTVLVLDCASQCECQMIIDWKEVWWEGARYGMVW